MAVNMSDLGQILSSGNHHSSLSDSTTQIYEIADSDEFFKVVKGTKNSAVILREESLVYRGIVYNEHHALEHIKDELQIRGLNGFQRKHIKYGAEGIIEFIGLKCIYSHPDL